MTEMGLTVAKVDMGRATAKPERKAKKEPAFGQEFDTRIAYTTAKGNKKYLTDEDA